MKKRINTIDGKILVQGGTDTELKSNEIRVNADKSLTERVNGEIVNVGGGSASGGLRPITADDVALFLTTEQYYDDSGKIEFQDTITITPYNKFFIKQLNPLAELAVLYTPNLIDNKMQANIWTPTKELFIYNTNSQNVDFNIKNVYIKD